MWPVYYIKGNLGPSASDSSLCTVQGPSPQVSNVHYFHVHFGSFSYIWGICPTPGHIYNNVCDPGPGAFGQGFRPDPRSPNLLLLLLGPYSGLFHVPKPCSCCCQDHNLACSTSQTACSCCCQDHILACSTYQPLLLLLPAHVLACSTYQTLLLLLLGPHSRLLPRPNPAAAWSTFWPVPRSKPCSCCRQDHIPACSVPRPKPCSCCCWDYVPACSTYQTLLVLLLGPRSGLFHVPNPAPAAAKTHSGWIHTEG